MSMSPARTASGKRYNRETLEVKFKGNSIADVLDMTVEDAEDFFKAAPRSATRMHTLDEVGLGYVEARPAGHHALWRRGAARQARQGTRPPLHRANALHPRRARPPASTSKTCSKLLEVLHRARRSGQQRRRHRAQPRCDQDRRLAARSRPRRRRSRRRTRWPKAPPNTSPKTPAALPATISPRC